MYGSENTADWLEYFGGQTQQFISLPDSTAYYGDYGKLKKTLIASNHVSNMYFTVSEVVAGKKRTKDKYLKTRAVFLDDDGADKQGLTDPSTFPIPPSLTVNSSPGKWHYYWLTDCDDGEAHEAVMRGIATTYNGDPSVTDRTRIMRLPGYIHRSTGHMVTWKETGPTYSWSEILEAFPPETIADSGWDEKRTPNKFNIKEATRDLVSADNIHEARRSIAMHYANMGVSKESANDMLIAIVEDMIKDGVCTKSRGLERIGNMQQAFDTAYTKVANELAGTFVDEAEEYGDKYTRIPKHTGTLGLLIDDIMKYARLPSYEMSVAVALNAVGMYGGGIYSLGTLTCARKRTILADTGRGKSIVDKYTNELVRRVALHGNEINSHAYDFMGARSFTPVVVHKQLMEHRVRCYLTSEAGLAGKSNTGRVYDSRALMLNLLTASRKTTFSPESFSEITAGGKAMNEAAKPIQGVCVVCLNESVPAQYIDVLARTDAFRSGDIGREEIYFIANEEEYIINEDAEDHIDDNIVATFYMLATQFHRSGRVAGTDPRNPEYFEYIDTSQIDDSLVEVGRKYHKLQYEASTNDNYTAHGIYTRVFERIKTTVLCQAIFAANYGQHDLVKPVATLEMLQWAMELQEELVRSCLAQTVKGHLADPWEYCVQRLVSRAQNYGKNKADKHNAYMNDLKTKLVTQSWISNILDLSKVKPYADLCNKYGRDRAYEQIVKLAEQKNVLILQPSIMKRRIWKINV
jgi:hypothetical protein